MALARQPDIGLREAIVAVLSTHMKLPATPAVPAIATPATCRVRTVGICRFPKRLYQNLERRASPVSTALFRRHEPLQLLDPVLHDDDARRRGGPVGAALFDHQEPLAVG